MKKTVIYRYDDVELDCPESLVAVNVDAECPVRIGYGMQFVGSARNFRITLGKLKCTVESSEDLRRFYPVLIATLDGGVGVPLSLTASHERMNINDNSEPFI